MPMRTRYGCNRLPCTCAVTRARTHSHRDHLSLAGIAAPALEPAAHPDAFEHLDEPPGPPGLGDAAAGLDARQQGDVTSLVDFQAVDSFAEHLRKKLSFLIIEADLIASLWPDACGVDKRVDHRDGRAWS
jgi:hypothetical protein